MGLIPTARGILVCRLSGERLIADSTEIGLIPVQVAVEVMELAPTLSWLCNLSDYVHVSKRDGAER